MGLKLSAPAFSSEGAARSVLAPLSGTTTNRLSYALRSILTSSGYPSALRISGMVLQCPTTSTLSLPFSERSRRTKPSLSS